MCIKTCKYIMLNRKNVKYYSGIGGDVFGNRFKH